MVVKIKRAQVTIFIIVGLLIVSAIVLFFLYKQNTLPGISGGKETNPHVFLQSCIEEKVQEGVDIMLSQGGYINNPLNKTFRFEYETEFSDISYLCYNQNYYNPCINQEPLLIQHLKKEIKNYISDDVDDCWNELESILIEKEGYLVSARYRGGDFDIDLVPGDVVIDINGELTLTKSEETTTRKDFKIFVPTKMYDLALVVQEIVSQEGRFCNFDHLGYMLIYSKFDINKFRTGKSTIIYTVQDKSTQEKYKFAVRSCVIPPGI